MKRLNLLGSLALCVSFWLNGCGGDEGSNIAPCQGPDCDPVIWMQALADSLANIPDGEPAEFYQNIRYTEIREAFDRILASDPNNKIAHLGSAILDIIEINYDADLWAFINDLLDYTDGSGRAPNSMGRRGGVHLQVGSPILRNQFTLLATAPRELMRRSVQMIPPSLTIARLQELLDTVVIPALSSASAHLTVSTSGSGAVFNLTVEDETVEIDAGEIHLFHASVRAASAGLRLLTAYNYDLPGTDGTYGWVDTIRDLERCDDFGYFEDIGGGELRSVFVYYDGTRTTAAQESVAVATLQYNLENRSEFLSLQASGMSDAFEDILEVRNLLERAVESVRGETDSQEDDVIKFLDLVDIDQDIATAGDRPKFAKGFTTIEDVLEWVDSILSGPYQVMENGQNGPINFTIDLAGFFRGAPENWRDALPYHRFEPASLWQTDVLEFESTSSHPPTEVTLFDCSTFISQSNVTQNRWEYRRVKMDPIKLTDPFGTDIDLAVAKIPYLPDYELSGLFPGATRQTWLDIHQNAGW